MRNCGKSRMHGGEGWGGGVGSGKHRTTARAKEEVSIKSQLQTCLFSIAAQLGSRSEKGAETGRKKN